INSILCLPIGNVSNPDCIVWPWCTNGLYSANFLLWSIWKARCQFIFEGCKPEPTRVLQMANSAAGDFFKACLPSNSTGITHTEVLSNQSPWTPPRIGWIKV
ncbi:unnamed protein product, partial [Prunus brigantina]